MIKSNWKQFIKGLDKLEKRDELKDMYNSAHWEFLDYIMPCDPEWTEDIADSDFNPLDEIYFLFKSPSDIEEFLFECAKENLPGAKEKLRRIRQINTCNRVYSSRQIKSGYAPYYNDSTISEKGKKAYKWLCDFVGQKLELGNHPWYGPTVYLDVNKMNITPEMLEEINNKMWEMGGYNSIAAQSGEWGYGSVYEVTFDQNRNIESSRRNKMIKSAYTLEDYNEAKKRGYVYIGMVYSNGVTYYVNEDGHLTTSYSLAKAFHTEYEADVAAQDARYPGMQWGVKKIIYNSRQIKSAYTREDYDRFDEVGNFIPYKPTEEELAKKDEIKKVLKQELSDAYEPDPMDNYVGYDSTNERIDMACERVAKQFGVDTDFVEEIAGEIDRENIARANAEPEYVYQHCKDKDRFWDWYNGEDVSLEELGIDKEQMNREVDEIVHKYVNSSRQIKSSLGPRNEKKAKELIDEYNSLSIGDSLYTSTNLGRYLDYYFREHGLSYGDDFMCPPYREGEIVKLTDKKVVSSRQITSANSQEEFEDLIIDIEDKLGVNVEHSNIFNLPVELTYEDECYIDDICREQNCRFVPVNGSRRQYRLIQSSRRNNMIKSGLTSFDRAIEKKYNGTSPNSAGQYYLDWRYNLADEKDYIEQLADKNGLSVEFQTDDGYFEVFSSRRNNMIKSSIITPWDTNQVTGTSDEDLGLSAVVDIYGNEFVNVDESILNELKDTLVRYFDDDAYVRDWNINNPDYQIEDAFEVTDPEEMNAEELARYFDYEAYGRDIRLEDNMVWDSENQYWISAHDVDDEELNNDKYIYMRG